MDNFTAGNNRFDKKPPKAYLILILLPPGPEPAPAERAA